MKLTLVGGLVLVCFAAYLSNAYGNIDEKDEESGVISRIARGDYAPHPGKDHGRGNGYRPSKGKGRGKGKGHGHKHPGKKHHGGKHGKKHHKKHHGHSHGKKHHKKHHGHSHGKKHGKGKGKKHHGKKDGKKHHRGHGHGHGKGRRCRRVDVGFVVDVSNSIAKSDLKKILSFIVKIVKKLKCGKNKVEVGIVKFATKIKIEFSIGKSKDKDDIIKAVKHLDRHGFCGGSNIGGGIKKGAYDLIYHGRKKVSKVLIVITDGLWTTGKDPVFAAQYARNEFVETIAIGVGKKIKKDVIYSIAGERRRSYTVFRYGRLHRIVKGIVRLICRGTCYRSHKNRHNKHKNSYNPHGKGKGGYNPHGNKHRGGKKPHGNKHRGGYNPHKKPHSNSGYH